LQTTEITEFVVKGTDILIVPLIHSFVFSVWCEASVVVG